MSEYPKDIFTEQVDIDNNTLANLGPLTGMAGIWQERVGSMSNLRADGPRSKPISNVSNYSRSIRNRTGRSSFTVCRITHVTKPDDVETYHSQVGYWLWGTGDRHDHALADHSAGQTALAIGKAKANDREFELVARRGSTENGICSNPSGARVPHRRIPQSG